MGLWSVFVVFHEVLRNNGPTSLVPRFPLLRRGRTLCRGFDTFCLTWSVGSSTEMSPTTLFLLWIITPSRVCYFPYIPKYLRLFVQVVNGQNVLGTPSDPTQNGFLSVPVLLRNDTVPEAAVGLKSVRGDLGEELIRTLNRTTRVRSFLGRFGQVVLKGWEVWISSRRIIKR